ncbi:hypothetical protein [Nonomuraea typhae]|uniref:FtsX extracellular domain-containing protein n=1 Tax=Nonomuraea typhae TaxID=2603600 RepID=A0ABW7ZB10_9ACTN
MMVLVGLYGVFLAVTPPKLFGVNQPPFQQYPAPMPPPGNGRLRKRPGLLAVIILAACLGLSLVGVGGYLVVRAVTKPPRNPVTAVILEPTASQATKDAIKQRLVSMPQADTVFYADAEELPEWFPGSRPWGDTNPEAYLVKLRPGIDSDTMQESLRTWPGVYMVTYVTVTDLTIGTGGTE